MSFISVRDMRIRPGEVWRQLQEEGDLIVTSSGRPFALMIATGGEDVEELLLALRRAKAQMAVSRLRTGAAAQGLDRLPDEAIDAEVAQARHERRQ